MKVKLKPLQWYWIGSCLNASLSLSYHTIQFKIFPSICGSGEWTTYSNDLLGNENYKDIEKAKQRCYGVAQTIVDGFVEKHLAN